MNVVCVIAAAIMMSASAIGGQFTYSYQLAGYEYDRYDEKGAIDFDRFVTLFDQFPWQNQVRAWDRLRKGCSATISVTDHDRQLDYWVSIAGDESESKFLLGVVYDKEVKGFLGFGKPRKTRWVEIYAAPSRESILSTYRLFFSGHTDELMHTLRSYELLDQLEARKPKA